MTTLVAKRCSACLLMKPMEAYTRRKGSSDGYRGQCRDCCQAADRQRRPRPTRRYRPRRFAACQRCQDRQHGPRCLGPASGCGCRCRAMLGLEGPFEFGDPTAPSALDWGVA